MSSVSLNVGNFVTLKLKYENYPLWREQVLALAESQELVAYLTGEVTIPEAILPPLEGSNHQSVPNPHFVRWSDDRLLRGWIIGTLSEEALGIVIGLDTSTQCLYCKAMKHELACTPLTQQPTLPFMVRKITQSSPTRELGNQPDNLPKAFAALNIDLETNNDEWISNTGASAHMTSHEGSSDTKGSNEGTQAG
ncbi:hypothetical protein Pint_30526 [Pistacia integerrima]|uniref:Uncharacterized protein n=1 Tax=Pistacia integerrima TaxID=434235 RepID=A0ACC0X0M2_9ROSI|nr:hypothetical protein Pint_30526 [Pistacia integerrima]